MRLRGKLWLLIVSSLILSLISFPVISILVGSKFDPGYDLNSLGDIISTTIEQIQNEQAFMKDRAQLILENTRQQHPQLRFEWIGSDGMPIYDTSNNSTPYSFKELMDRFTSLPTNLWTDGQQITLAASTDQDQQSYYLLVSLPSEAMKQGQFYLFMRNYNKLFTLVIPLLPAFLVPYLLSLWFFSSINRRLRKLSGALNRVNLHKEDSELQDNASDEIGQLNKHFNDMARRIRAQVTQIEQFENRRVTLLSNLSHDLRTPLTMILGYAETIRVGHYKDENELKSSAKIILQHSRYMDSLLRDILDVSRQDINALNIHISHEDLSELIRKVIADYLLTINENQFTLQFDIPENELVIPMDALLIERAIRNLLENAIRYGHEGHYLGVRLIEEQDAVSITITDKGKGIDPKDRDFIFDRFYRSEGRTGPGLGIGLSIVKDITEAHQGSVELSSIPYQETVFRIQLPKQ